MVPVVTAEPAAWGGTVRREAVLTPEPREVWAVLPELAAKQMREDLWELATSHQVRLITFPIMRRETQAQLAVMRERRAREAMAARQRPARRELQEAGQY